MSYPPSIDPSTVALLQAVRRFAREPASVRPTIADQLVGLLGDLLDRGDLTPIQTALRHLEARDPTGYLVLVGGATTATEALVLPSASPRLGVLLWVPLVIAAPGAVPTRLTPAARAAAAATFHTARLVSTGTALALGGDLWPPNALATPWLERRRLLRHAFAAWPQPLTGAPAWTWPPDAPQGTVVVLRFLPLSLCFSTDAPDPWPLALFPFLPDPSTSVVWDRLDAWQAAFTTAVRADTDWVDVLPLMPAPWDDALGDGLHAWTDATWSLRLTTRTWPAGTAAALGAYAGPTGSEWRAGIVTPAGDRLGLVWFAWHRTEDDAATPRALLAAHGICVTRWDPAPRAASVCPACGGPRFPWPDGSPDTCDQHY